MVSIKFFAIFLFILSKAAPASAQLKFILEDFEGLAEAQTQYKKEGIFTYGNAQSTIEKKITQGSGYSGERAIRIDWKGENSYGGWGKGIGLNIELDVKEDFLNFYVYNPVTNNKKSIGIKLEEDDNNNGTFEEKLDDSWYLKVNLEPKNEWQLISLPLLEFKDVNIEGDNRFNVNYKEGKLLTFVVILPSETKKEDKLFWYFDFINFSKGRLSFENNIFTPPSASEDDFCFLGTWSDEGNIGNFLGIADGFEAYFRDKSDRKIGIVHLFQSFSMSSDETYNISGDKINLLIERGYIPLITLENHYTKGGKKIAQPNLYSIVEGHFDNFFKEWAKRLKKADGIILLRILHEFNGNWYPWCIANNNNNPQLYIQAYKHIWNIFNKEDVKNVKFIWCPNSMSSPQEGWNFIMNAYPGDLYVDYVGMDVYNGAGNKNSTPIWRSFRKETIENYFILTENLPYKPLLICETSSRERTKKEEEEGNVQDKAQWISQMSEALRSDLSKVRLLVWFNEYKTFKINSSNDSKKAFLKHVFDHTYFKSGSESFFSLIP